MFRPALLAMFAAMTSPWAAGENVLLTTHNELRVRHGVPPLAWSQSLANGAQKWAEKCIFEHSNGRYGENLAWWRGGTKSSQDYVRAWYAEIEDFDFADPEQNDFRVTGHFTQIVWRESVTVGCGAAECADGAKMLVCRYSPSGNVRGGFRANLPPPK